MPQAPWRPGLVLCAIGLLVVPFGPLLMSLHVVEDTSAYVGIVLQGSAVSLFGLALAGIGAALAVWRWARQ